MPYYVPPGGTPYKPSLMEQLTQLGVPQQIMQSLAMVQQQRQFSEEADIKRKELKARTDDAKADRELRKSIAEAELSLRKEGLDVETSRALSDQIMNLWNAARGMDPLMRDELFAGGLEMIKGTPNGKYLTAETVNKLSKSMRLGPLETAGAARELYGPLMQMIPKTEDRNALHQAIAGLGERALDPDAQETIWKAFGDKVQDEKLYAAALDNKILEISKERQLKYREGEAQINALNANAKANRAQARSLDAAANAAGTGPALPKELVDNVQGSIEKLDTALRRYVTTGQESEILAFLGAGALPGNLSAADKQAAVGWAIEQALRSRQHYAQMIPGLAPPMDPALADRLLTPYYPEADKRTALLQTLGIGATGPTGAAPGATPPPAPAAALASAHGEAAAPAAVTPTAPVATMTSTAYAAARQSGSATPVTVTPDGKRIATVNGIQYEIVK